MNGSRAATRILLVALFVGMAVCARTPDSGPVWRVAFVLFSLAAGILVFVCWKSGGVSRREVLLMAILLRVIVFPLSPSLSDDGFRYVWDGMIQAQDGTNPYHYIPADSRLAAFHQDVIYKDLNSRNYYTVYPPLSQLVFALGGLLYPLGWIASWYLIKLLMVGGELCGLFFLSRMVKPKHLLLYAWNPLVVIETAGQAHTEALTVGLILLAVWAARTKRPGLSGGSVAAAGWVKLMPFALAPLVLRRSGWKALIGGFLVACVLAAPYAASYVIPHFRESLELYVRSFEFNAGPYLAIKGISTSVGLGDVSKIVGPALQWAFLLSLPVAIGFDWRWKPALEFSMVAVFSLFFLTATTIHPWYLVPLLALLPMVMDRDVGRWYGLGWMLLGLCSMATYLKYAGPPWGYGAAVWTGWLFWSACMTVAFAKVLMPRLMRYRAEKKWKKIERHLPDALRTSSRVLDMGAGEGFVGDAIRQSTGANVTLVDVVDFNETQMPLVLYDGRALPFDDDSFDLTLVVFVLHHTKSAEQTLLEAKRATTGHVVVLESVFKAYWQHRLLTILDRLANRLRSGGKMRAHEKHLNFRTDAAWLDTFTRLGFRIEHASQRGRWIHRQALYVLNASTSSAAASTDENADRSSHSYSE